MRSSYNVLTYMVFIQSVYTIDICFQLFYTKYVAQCYNRKKYNKIVNTFFDKSTIIDNNNIYTYILKTTFKKSSCHFLMISPPASQVCTQQTEVRFRVDCFTRF